MNPQDMNPTGRRDDTDQDVARLMEIAGHRTRPPADVEQRVRVATMKAWAELPEPAADTGARAASPVLPTRWLALAASMLAAVTIGYLTLDGALETEPMGEITYSSGEHLLGGSDTDQASRIMPGAILRTSAGGRLGIQIAGGPNIRFDEKTSATLHPDEIWLHSGRIYVDNESGRSIRITAPTATITDIGTQFEVSQQGDLLEVAVREGEVAIATGAATFQARVDNGVGELLTLQNGTLHSRTTLDTMSDRWSWTRAARAPFNLHQASVYDFLQWAARDSGRSLSFENDIVRRQATLLRFSGHVDADSDDEHINLALRTTSFILLDTSTDKLVLGHRSI